MLSPQELEIIKETTREFFEKTGFEIEIDFLAQEEQTLPISLKTEDPQVLIGEGGQTLAAIQHLLKSMLKRKIEQPFYIDLDVNGYKKKKLEYLRELAKTTADEVSLAKKEKSLAPMPAYERRVIHMALAEREDVVSESIGQEPERKVVIRPYP